MKQHEQPTIIGRYIVAVRTMTRDEAKVCGWEAMPDYMLPPVIELDNGVILYPSTDETGNEPGCMFVRIGEHERPLEPREVAYG